MIIQSLLDLDFYKITQGQMVFNQFPEAVVTYRFMNRGGTVFSLDFAKAVREQIDMLSHLSITQSEYRFLQNIRLLKPTYLEWFKHYSFNPEEVKMVIVPCGGGKCNLDITIHGPWYRVIFFETVIMSIVSELYFSDKPMAPDWKERIVVKADKMQAAGLNWLDFGTRRRASLAVQDEVVRIMKGYKNFRGTSNVHLAHSHGCKAQGSIAHEAEMAMQAKYGIRMAPTMVLDHWAKEYGGDLGIMLPDTLTTPVFMRALTRRDAKLWDGARQDSGDLALHAQEYIDRLISLDVDPQSKLLMPSDSLTDDTAIAFYRKFAGKVKGVTAGLGTFLSNDCWASASQLFTGIEPVCPLNMVIKMTDADFGYGPIHVVKLSDTPGKNMGDARQIDHVKRELGV